MSVAIEAMAQPVLDALLAPRRTRLHRRAPTSHGVHQLRRSIQCGKARPVQMLLQVAADDLHDGVPLPEVEGPFRELLEAVRLLGAHYGPATGPHLVAFMRRETDAEALLRICELDAVQTPDSLPVLARLAAAVTRRESTTVVLGNAIRSRRLFLLAHPVTRIPHRVAV